MARGGNERHYPNYLRSKLEIIRSRMLRITNKNNTLAEENPPMFATMKSLRCYFEEVRLSQKNLEQKAAATPFVSLTTGKIEEPLQLPSFKTFLDSVGGDRPLPMCP